MAILSSNYRPLAKLPRSLIVFVVLTLSTQIVWHRWAVMTHVNHQALPIAPSFEGLQVLAIGDVEVTAKLIMLWLQAFDNQPGISLPLQALDYARLDNWLQLISDMDKRSQYALFSASYIYSAVANTEKQRRVFDFIERNFKQQPNTRWRWLAHAAIMAQHRLHDNQLALHYARLLRQYATGKEVPSWAQQMEIGILETNGEYESAKLLIGGLLSEQKITDKHELAFLNDRLKSIKATTESMIQVVYKQQ